MELNSRAIGLLMGLSVAVITTAFLYLVPTISHVALFIAFGLSFSSTYILVRFVLEFLFFRHINKIYESLENIDKEGLEVIQKPRRSSVNPLKRINKEIEGYVENKQREIEELKRMEIFRREFMADVSHELKTPIFAAQGFVHTLLDGAMEDRKVRSKFLKKAAKSLDGLDMLVHDLLTLSHIETGEIKMHMEYFNLNEMISEVVDQFETKASKKDISLSVTVATKPIFVHADYQRIYQVLLNLVSNAIKYTKKEGLVEISFEEVGDHVKIAVRDNGDGIPEADINRIFERFYRVDKSRSKEKGGTGLGLAIVKHILEGHNSKVEVASVYGEGSIFTFKLAKGMEVEKNPVLEDEY